MAVVSKLKITLGMIISVSLILLAASFTGQFSSVGITGRAVEAAKNCTTTLEQFEIKIPYDHELKYYVADSKLSADRNDELGFYYKAIVTIANEEPDDGSFTVNYKFETPNGDAPQKSTKLVKANSRETFEFTYPSKENEVVSGSFAVEAAIEKGYKNGTIYKQVERCS